MFQFSIPHQGTADGWGCEKRLRGFRGFPYITGLCIGIPLPFSSKTNAYRIVRVDVNVGHGARARVEIASRLPVLARPPAGQFGLVASSNRLVVVRQRLRQRTFFGKVTVNRGVAICIAARSGSEHNRIIECFRQTGIGQYGTLQDVGCLRASLGGNGLNCLRASLGGNGTNCLRGRSAGEGGTQYGRQHGLQNFRVASHSNRAPFQAAGFAGRFHCAAPRGH